MGKKKISGKAIRPSINAAEVLENINDGYLAVNHTWDFTYVNKQAAFNLGFKSEDLIGHNLWEKLSFLAGTEAEQRLRRVMSGNEPYMLEIQNPLTNRIFCTRVFPSGNGISIFWTDVTESKQAEESLKETRFLFQSYFDSPGILRGIIEIVDDAVIRHVIDNQASARLLGLTPDELRNRTSLDLGEPEEYIRTLVKHCRESRETGKPSRFEYFETRGEKPAWLSVIAVCIGTSSGEQMRYIYIVSNITERKETENALARARDDLETTVRERTRELAAANEQLKQYSHRLTMVQEEERKRIAYELHDDTAQSLSILKMQLNALLQSGKIRETELVENLQSLEKDAGRAFNGVRRYSHELRPVVLEHMGLLAALEQIADDYNKLGQLIVEVKTDGVEPELSEEVKLGFFRIAQEALNNTRKHSKASRALIDLKFQKNRLKMSVSDNGTGFDTGKAGSRFGFSGSLGLMSMQERANLIDAELKIESEPGKGTLVTVQVEL